ncbi:methionine--tRNA ligase [Planctomycetota bacterium]
MTRKLLVTSALPYANGPIHLGHLVEYLQTDMWVRFQKLCGHTCFYFCADDTHGTPIMLSARAAGIEPEAFIEAIHQEHAADFAKFHVDFDNYYSTHSSENQHFSELIFTRLKEAGSIVTRDVEQAFCENCNISLPDRYIRGTCPRCKTEDQYGDSCESCGATYRPTELIDPQCATCGQAPVPRTSLHYFFKLGDYESQLNTLIAQGYTQQSVANKLQEWFAAGLKDWDISRDGPYFGFKIPGEENKYFYVWLDAPIGYIASAKNYCDRQGIDFDKVWPGENAAPDRGEYELYHFIGKDIMYFHALFWPAMLMGANFKVAQKLFVHGFLTVNGEKMSKSRGTFIKAGTYAAHLDPEYLRYYYASKLSDSVDDIDLGIEDFINKVNADLVGKFANLASRSGPMLTKKLDGQLGSLNDEGRALIDKLLAAQESVVADYEGLRYAAVVRTVTALAADANQYVEQHKPWDTIKVDSEATRVTLTTTLNAMRVLTVYLKPILPVFAQKVEAFLNIPPLQLADLDSVLENHTINKFTHLFARVDKKQVDTMIEESKEDQAQPAGEPVVESTEPTFKDESTIDDFMKIDLRVAKVLEASAVEGADKLLSLKLDVGGVIRNVFAGIALAYRPEDLVGRLVIFYANLKPRKMRFGLSEGMVLASGPGGKDVFLLKPDEGAQPGDEVR